MFFFLNNPRIARIENDRALQSVLMGNLKKFPNFFKTLDISQGMHHYDTVPLSWNISIYSCMVSKSVYISSLAKLINPFWILFRLKNPDHLIADFFSVVSYARVRHKIVLNWSFVWLFLVLCKLWNVFVFSRGRMD